jgi:hypothetical protein
MNHWATALLIVFAVRPGAAQSTRPGLAHITVCTEGLANFQIAAQSHGIASRMFAEAGVRIDWRQGLDGCPEQSILITFSDKTPAGFHPGALALALP